MSAADWNGVRVELERWTADGIKAQFWIRDDDACEVTAPLERLAALAGRFKVKIGLAVVPALLSEPLVARLQCDKRHFMPMCHGWNHRNHGSSKVPGEFGADRPLLAMKRDAKCAREVFIDCFGQVPPFFVPPYGRITRDMEGALGAIGFSALSNGPDRLQARVVRLHRLTDRLPVLPVVAMRPRRLDVQLDPINWRAKTARSSGALARDLVAELRARRKRYIAYETPIGLLTHHLVHDDAIWNVCDELLTVLRAAPAATFPDISRLMGAAVRRGASGFALATGAHHTHSVIDKV